MITVFADGSFLIIILYLACIFVFCPAFGRPDLSAQGRFHYYYAQTGGLMQAAAGRQGRGVPEGDATDTEIALH